MNIEIHKPELEQMVQEEILRGQFRNVDELLIEALRALREKYSTTSPASERQNLADFLLGSPFAGSDLDLERQQDYGRTVHL